MEIMLIFFFKCKTGCTSCDVQSGEAGPHLAQQVYFLKKSKGPKSLKSTFYLSQAAFLCSSRVHRRMEEARRIASQLSCYGGLQQTEQAGTNVQLNAGDERQQGELPLFAQ